MSGARGAPFRGRTRARQCLLQVGDDISRFFQTDRQANQPFADAVHRFVPWVKTPQDVIRLLDRYLVFSSVRDAKLGLIDPDGGVEDLAGQVLGPSQYTTNFFDLTKQYSLIYPSPAGGTYQEMYATALSRSLSPPA